MQEICTNGTLDPPENHNFNTEQQNRKSALKSKESKLVEGANMYDLGRPWLPLIIFSNHTSGGYIFEDFTSCK